MSLVQPDRNSPEYIEAVIAVKPKEKDGRDERIRGLVRETLFREPWAIDLIKSIYWRQIDYIKDLVSNVGDPTYAHNASQQVLANISDRLKSTIVEGEEHLAGLQGQSILATTNHLGL